MRADKKWISYYIIAICVLAILIAAVIYVPGYIDEIRSERFKATRACYEESLIAIEGYKPEGSPIESIEVNTAFRDFASLSSITYSNTVTITVYVSKEYAQKSDKETFLDIYPYDVKLHELTERIKEVSGYGPFVRKYIQNSSTKIDGHRAEASDQIAYKYVVINGEGKSFVLDSSTFTVYSDDTKISEYSYRIAYNRLNRFRKTYPSYTGSKPSTWDPNKNSTGSSSSTTSGKSSGSSSGSSSSSSSGKSGSSSRSSSKSGKKYDPYNVYDYDNAWDFADDKYEEFFDYEDDYEDEDEAFDAAEDYWRAHHK